MVKINYQIHTDAVKNHLIPFKIQDTKFEGLYYASEADLLNLALFAMTAIVSYAQLLTDEAVRTDFYQKFSAFGRILKLAFSSIDFENNTPEKTKTLYRTHLKFYAELRNTVINTYSDNIDFKQYEKQLQKLLDQHVITGEVIRLTEQVSILDTEAFERELEKIIGSRHVGAVARHTEKLS